MLTENAINKLKIGYRGLSLNLTPRIWSDEEGGGGIIMEVVVGRKGRVFELTLKSLSVCWPLVYIPHPKTPQSDLQRLISSVNSPAEQISPLIVNIPNLCVHVHTHTAHTCADARRRRPWLCLVFYPFGRFRLGFNYFLHWTGGHTDNPLVHFHLFILFCFLWD